MKNETFVRFLMYFLGLAAGIMIGRAIVWRWEAPLDMECNCEKQWWNVCSAQHPTDDAGTAYTVCVNMASNSPDQSFTLYGDRGDLTVRPVTHYPMLRADAGMPPDAGDDRYRVQVSACYPATYLWAGQIERMPEQSDVLAEPTYPGSNWYRIQFTAFACGDLEHAARTLSKTWALAESLSAWEIDSLLTEPKCVQP